MKKIICVFLSVLMIVSFASCGETVKDKEDQEVVPEGENDQMNENDPTDENDRIDVTMVTAKRDPIGTILLCESGEGGIVSGGAFHSAGEYGISTPGIDHSFSELEGTQIQAGFTAVQAHAKTTFAGQSRTLKKDTWLLPNLYVTHKWSDDVSFGLGMFSRYGLGGTYKNRETWPGSNLAYRVKLATFSFTPTIAIKANEQLSVAMGLEAMTIDFTQNSQFQMPANTYEIHGTGVSWGGNFSLTYRPEWAQKWAIGAMYRSKVKQNLNGYVHSAGTYNAINIHNSPAEGAINLPDSISTGISFRPTENWTLEGGIVATFWSSYDQIIIQYKDASSVPFINPQKLYKDTFRVNFGTEYMLTSVWALRGGYVFDKSPINKSAMDTLVPVDDRHIVSMGFGYKGQTWSADFAYAHIFGRDLSGKSASSPIAPAGAPMKYSGGRSDMIALTVGYKF